jgi:hypothetical protein
MQRGIRKNRLIEVEINGSIVLDNRSVRKIIALFDTELYKAI